MNILLANDDGIDSPGIKALADALKDEYDIYIAAPLSQRSAYSHSVTYFYRKNRAERREIEGVKEAYAIDCTPADCTYYGVNGLFKKKMDLVISGINIGRNLASDVIYSGTVAAAGEAMIQKVPGIAVSLCSYQASDFKAAADAVKRIIPYFMNCPQKDSFILNINVPDLPENEIKGIRVTDLHDHVDYARPVERDEKDGELFLFINDDDMRDPESSREMISDVEAVNAGYIAVTPLYYDLCARNHINDLLCMETIRLNGEGEYAL